MMADSRLTQSQIRALLNAPEIAETALRRIAGILGGGSAAAQALRNIAERRTAGEDAVCYQYGRAFVVGPRLVLEQEEARDG